MSKTKDGVLDGQLDAPVEQALTDAEQRARLDELLQKAAGAQGAGITLPEVLGEFRQVEGKPKWFIRPMTLRQEIRATEIKRAMVEKADPLLDYVTFAALMMWRVRLPAEPEEAYELIRQAVAEDDLTRIFRPATTDEVLDHFNEEQLNRLVLTPLGYGAQEGEERAPFDAPTTPP